jgi:hypothetical protein
MKLLQNFILTILVAGCSATDKSGLIKYTGQGKPTQFPTLAGGVEIGNGGDMVVCETPYLSLDNRSVDLLDYFEARSIRNWTLDIGTLGTTADEMIQNVLARLSAIDPDRAQRLSAFVGTFWEEADIVPNVYLPNLPDDGPVALPGPDCRVEQLAIHQTPNLPGEKRYIISENLWTGLSEAARAGLVLHEVIYRDARESGHTTSGRSRYLTGLYSSTAMSSMTPETMAQLLKQFDLPHVFTTFGHTFELASLKRGIDGLIVSGMLLSDILTFPGPVIYSVQDPAVEFSGADRMRFMSDDNTFTIRSNGSVIEVEPPGNPHSSQEYRMIGDWSYLSRLPIPLYNLDQPRSILVPTFEEIDWDRPYRVFSKLPTANGEDFWIRPGYFVRFEPNGLLDRTIVPHPIKLQLNRPTTTDNTVSHTEFGVQLNLHNQEHAKFWFDRLADEFVGPDLVSGGTSIQHSDGETRWIALPARGFSLVCRQWDAPQAQHSCEAVIRTEQASGYESDMIVTESPTQWSAKAERNYRNQWHHDPMTGKPCAWLFGPEGTETDNIPNVSGYQYPWGGQCDVTVNSGPLTIHAYASYHSGSSARTYMTVTINKL